MNLSSRALNHMLQGKLEEVKVLQTKLNMETKLHYAGPTLYTVEDQRRVKAARRSLNSWHQSSIALQMASKDNTSTYT